MLTTEVRLCWVSSLSKCLLFPSPLYGGPPLSREKKLTAWQKVKPHGIKKNLAAKRKRLTAKFLQCREDIFILFAFAVRLFFLPWRYSFCRESFSFCREVFLFALRFFFLPGGFSFCPEVISFPVTVGWATVPLKFCSRRFLIFFNMWVFVRTSTNFAHLVSFHYSSHRIRGLARSENAGHFCMSDKWKQSFQNAALSPRFLLGAHRNNMGNESSSLENPLGN